MIWSVGKSYSWCLAHRVGVARQLDITYDGDMVSVNAILSEEANTEIDGFLNSIQSVVNSQKELLIGARDDLIGYTLLQLSRQ